jgi:hypothetical protein
MKGDDDDDDMPEWITSGHLELSFVNLAMSAKTTKTSKTSQTRKINRKPKTNHAHLFLLRLGQRLVLVLEEVDGLLAFELPLLARLQILLQRLVVSTGDATS